MVKPKGISPFHLPSGTRWGIEEALPLNEVYLILAGFSFRDRAQPYQVHSLQWRRGDLDKDPANSQIIVVPRSLSMERRLENQRIAGSSSINFSLCVNPFSRKGLWKGRKLDHLLFCHYHPVGYKEIGEEEVKGWGNGSFWLEFSRSIYRGYFILSSYAIKLIAPKLQKEMGPGFTLVGVELKTPTSPSGNSIWRPWFKTEILHIEEVKIYPRCSPCWKNLWPLKNYHPSSILFFYRSREERGWSWWG